MSMPIPSPSMKAMIGLSGTLSDASGLMVMRWPSSGTLMCSYCIDCALTRRAVLADQHCEFERLFVIEPRIHGRLVGPREVRVGQTARAPGTLGDVFAGELDVHAAEER